MGIQTVFFALVYHHGTPKITIIKNQYNISGYIVIDFYPVLYSQAAEADAKDAEVCRNCYKHVDFKC